MYSLVHLSSSCIGVVVTVSIKMLKPTQKCVCIYIFAKYTYSYNLMLICDIFSLFLLNVCFLWLDCQLKLGFFWSIILMWQI